MKYKVYATVTGKIHLGKYEANNRIEAAKIAIEDRAEVIKANLSVEGIENVSVVPYDSVEVRDKGVENTMIETLGSWAEGKGFSEGWDEGSEAVEKKHSYHGKIRNAKKIEEYVDSRRINGKIHSSDSTPQIMYSIGYLRGCEYALGNEYRLQEERRYIEHIKYNEHKEKTVVKINKYSIF